MLFDRIFYQTHFDRERSFSSPTLLHPISLEMCSFVRQIELQDSTLPSIDVAAKHLGVKRKIRLLKNLNLV
jgi:hypothetical protein